MAHTAWARRDRGASAGGGGAGRRGLSESYGRTICQWTGQAARRTAGRPRTRSCCRPPAAGMDLRDLAGLAAEMYQRSRPDLPDEDPARAFEDRGGAAGDHLRRRRGDVRGPDPGVRRGRRGGAGRAVRPGRRRGHPDPRAAVPRRAAGGDAPAAGRGAAARAGRAAGQGPGARVAGRPDAAGRQLGAAGAVDRRGPRAVGRARAAASAGRQRRRRVAGRRRRPRRSPATRR